jgi:tetratricopeptide (TPR) repeat protein
MNYKINKDIISSPWSALVLITVVVVIIYSNIYNAPFVFDDEHILETKKLRDLSNYSSLERILEPRNIVHLTFFINYKLCGLNVIGYHITNVLIHIVNGFLVYFLALIIFGRLNKTSCQEDVGQARPRQNAAGLANGLAGRATVLMSLFAALIFVSHPIQTQAVTYTIQRMASMAAMFYLASIFLYLKARIVASDLNIKTQNRFPLILYILSGFCGALALLSKQSAASLPGAILLVEYLFINRAWFGWKKTIPWFSFSFVLWVIFVSYILGLFSSGINSGNLSEDIFSLARIEQVTISRWEYLCTQFNVLVIYIRMLFLPVHQCIDYLYPYKEGFLDGYTPIAFLFLVGLVAIGVTNIRKRPIITLAVFWFFITLSVESSIIPLYAYFEHRLYLPMFGFSMFASWLLFHLFPNRRSWVIVSYVIIIILFGTATYNRNGVWQDKIKLWSDAVSKSPQNHRTHSNLGASLVENGRFDEVIIHCNEALRIKPDYAPAHITIGVSLAEEGRFDEAIFHCQEALRIKPNDADAHKGMGTVLIKENKFDEAIFHYKEALRIKPYDADAHNNLGIALYEEGKFKEAIFHYKEALRIKPNYADAHNNLGNALSRQGRPEEAIFHYKEALRIKPDYAIAHNSLGVFLEQQGKHEEAILHFEEALRIKPGYVKVHNNLGIVLTNQERSEEAIVHYNEAIRIKPDYVDALNNLSWLLATSKDPSFRNATKAVELAEKVCELTGHKGPLMLDTLAAAYAGAGRFDEASQTASRAIEMAKSNGQQELAGDIEKRMQLYKSGRPLY